MPLAVEPRELKELPKINGNGPDDFFICSASFEERCLSATRIMGKDFRTKFAIIFMAEDAAHKREIENNFYQLQAELNKRTSEGIFVITCQRDNATEGVNQLKEIWKKCTPKCADKPYITLDISGFSKIYILQLLNYIVNQLKLEIPRLIHTTQTYTPTKLTKGVSQITTVPNYFGHMTLSKKPLPVLFIGFEPERTMAVWQHFNPEKTIALVTNPPRSDNSSYVKYARESNEALLCKPSVEVRDVPADNPQQVYQVLEQIHRDVSSKYTMVIGPFGTKPQTVGVFLFLNQHPEVQVIYSFPADYTNSYLKRRPGVVLQLPVNTSLL